MNERKKNKLKQEEKLKNGIKKWEKKKENGK